MLLPTAGNLLVVTAIGSLKLCEEQSHFGVLLETPKPERPNLERKKLLDFT